MVLSIISVVSSTMSCSISDLNTFSHTPCFVHRLKRLYTLLHGPNLSGKSRHGIPVFSQYIMPFSITRLSFAGRPPWGFSFRRQYSSYFLPLLVAYFMSSHYLIIPLFSSFCNIILSLQTLSKANYLKKFQNFR